MTDRTDNFNRANGGLGANWTALTDANVTDTLTIVSNAVTGTAINLDSASYWSADTFQNDQYSQCVVAGTLGGDNMGPTVRNQATGTKRYEYDGGVSSGQTLYYYDGATGWNTLASSGGITNGDTLRLEVTGTSLVCKDNGSQTLTATDATLSSGAPGMHANPQFTTNCNMDDWLGGPITAGVTLDTAWFRPSEDRLPRRFLADTCAAIALTPPTAPVVIPGMAWFAPPDRNKPATKVLFDQVPAPMGTSFPRVYGMGWFAPPDKDKLATKVRVESPPALALTNIAYVSGIGWHNPPDRDKKATKITTEAPPAIALTPDTLPPKIAGMAWFEPLDTYPPRALGKSDPHSFSLGPTTPPTPISGMAWFAPRDRDRPAVKVSVESTPAWNPQVITQTVTAPLTGWWTSSENVRRYVQRCDCPAMGSSPPVQPILWWSAEDCKPRAPRQLSDVPAFSLTDTSQIPGMGWFARLDDLVRKWKLLSDQPSQIFTFQTPTTVFNTAWFVIPDRDRPALKQFIEALPSLSLTPNTLPPKIAGMAWFQPWERAVIGRGVSVNSVFAWNPQVIVQAPPPSGDQYRVSGQEVRDLFLHDGVSYPSAITRKTNL